MESTYPGDACPASRDEITPTAFQRACAIMSLLRRDEQAKLTNHPDFSLGWEVGVERDLGDHMFPNLHNRELDMNAVYDSQRAFVLGLTCGLIAEQKGYSTPFCNFPEHGSACEGFTGSSRTDQPTADASRTKRGTAQLTGDATGGFELSDRT